MITSCRRPVRGVSLIEALVALAVLAFGILGLVGLQATMRVNADVAKQRAEATRLAQERIEAMRSYGSIAEYGANVVDAAAAPATALSSTNTTYTIATEVSPDVLPANRPPLRSATVTVSWADRASQPQSVVLATQVAGVSPAVTGGLSTAGYGFPARRVYGRNAAIPLGASDQGNGTSQFTPPGASGNPTYVFNNVTGLITQVCTTAGTVTTCSAANLALVSGFVSFDLGRRQPTAQDAEQPASPSPNDVAVRANWTSPTATGTVNCYNDRQSLYVAYYCAIPLYTGDLPFYWSGIIKLREDLPQFRVADNASDDHDDRYRVCRYTPATSDSETVPPSAHPRTYTRVTTSLANQNFLVIRAGNGHDPFTCPGDDTSTDYVNGNTLVHQPAPASP